MPSPPWGCISPEWQVIFPARPYDYVLKFLINLFQCPKLIIAKVNTTASGRIDRKFFPLEPGIFLSLDRFNPFFE